MTGPRTTLPGRGIPPPHTPQTTLFADPPSCTARGCQAGTRKNLCRWEADRENYGIAGKQPRGCLLRHDPKDGVIPF